MNDDSMSEMSDRIEGVAKANATGVGAGGLAGVGVGVVSFLLAEPAYGLWGIALAIGLGLAAFYVVASMVSMLLVARVFGGGR